MCQISILFGIVCRGGFVYLKQYSSFVSETKREAILFRSEVNSAGFSEIEELIRLRKKYFSPSGYMLITDISNCAHIDVIILLGVAVIYGPPLESYTFMQGLLTSGVPGSRIVLVQLPQKPPTPFNNPDVEALVEQSLQKAGKIFISN